MKIEALKKIIKETVKEAIQEELKEVLYESFKAGARPQIVETPQMTPPPVQPKSAPLDRQQIRESYMNVLGDMKSQFTTGNIPTQPLQVHGPVDTTSPNGKLPDGEVSMDQIMGIMNKG
jgi:hypothetical protein